ncbi:hypothetical protein ABZ464_33105 [Streptomyces sp. NPDC005820]|uniref:hypothetical protein n=1 Tax=Streptomyces sp. NPDC005820 TaxID=3157069 RepID=UPI0033EFCA40
MSATVDSATAEDSAGPIRRPADRFPGRAPDVLVTFFRALALLCLPAALAAPLRALRGQRRPKSGPRPTATEGPPPPAALGLDGGDEAGGPGPDADLPEQVRVRHHPLDRPRAAGPDLGDHLPGTGRAGTGDKGGPAVFGTSRQPTTPRPRPLPDERRGLTDPGRGSGCAPSTAPPPRAPPPA